MKAKKSFTLKRQSQVPDLKPAGLVFQSLKTKLTAERPPDRQQVKVAAVKASQSISREETENLLMSTGFRPSLTASLSVN